LSDTAGDSAARPAVVGNLPALGLSALGVVFGDIGTSPLYTLKTVLGLTAGAPDPATTLGLLSLLIWTLIVVTTVKYVSVAMSVDNDGEGGILALLSLLGVQRGTRPVIIAVGLFGAALIYGDGAITPAISVLSALEGLNIAAPAVAPYVLPASVLILIALFAIQPQGTARIGRAFGPIMALWFVTIAVLGIWGISQHPSVLIAIDPRYGASYLLSGGWAGFLVLGAVFLCVTGAEALYADMGHFGARPIRLAWSAIVFPSLVLNYAGQASLVLDGAPVSDNIFYRLCPSFLLLPLVVLATVATIIASQSIITGAFSMTRQAIQLGWLPRLQIRQTSATGYGQIYVGSVNWLLMLVTLGLTVGFGKSDNLAAAYGIAVSATMLMTSALLFIAMREVWGWSMAAAGAAAGAFMVVDASFFAAALRCGFYSEVYFFTPEPREGGGRRLCAARPRSPRLWGHADLAPRSRRGHRPAARAGGTGGGLHGYDCRGTHPPCARHGGVFDADPARCASCHGLAPQAQPRAARAPPRPDRRHRTDAMAHALETACGRRDRAAVLARFRPLWLHGSPRHSRAVAGGASTGMRDRSRGRHLLCRA
jgi:KUP system potassium uptake protein